MSAPEYTLRRATVDDLVGLKLLWDRTHLQVLDLERRLTEFQLLVSDTGDLMGAVGLQIDGKQGRIHSESLAQPENQDAFRQQLWERVLAVARNYGLVRLWTDETAPFWGRRGFQEVDAEIIKKKLPAGFGDPSKRWLALQLREESAAAVSMEHEFELFQAAQKEGADKLMQQAKSLKTVAYTILAIAILVGLYFVVRVLVRNPSILMPGRR